jgi:hypothetical protein
MPTGFLRGGIGFHLARRRVAMFAMVTLGAAATRLAPAGSGRSGGALLVATALLALIQMAGSVGGEIRAGRAVLGIGAAGGASRWLFLELAGRLGAVVVACAAMVLLAGATLIHRPTEAASLVAALPFLSAVAILVAAVAYACSAVADRLDGMIAVLYLVPLTLAAVGLAAAQDTPDHSWTWAVVPVDALFALAPRAPAGSATTGAALRVGAFIAVWLGGGLAASRVRLAWAGAWPRG